MSAMDQRELVRQLEAHFRKEDESAHEHRKIIQQERRSHSNEEWWDRLIEQTKSIRPQMLEVFERNKAEMIANRFETINSEEGYREKTIQRRVMELLPFISKVRTESGASGDLSAEEIANALSLKAVKEETAMQNPKPSLPKDLLDRIAGNLADDLKHQGRFHDDASLNEALLREIKNSATKKLGDRLRRGSENN